MCFASVIDQQGRLGQKYCVGDILIHCNRVSKYQSGRTAVEGKQLTISNKRPLFYPLEFAG